MMKLHLSRFRLIGTLILFALFQLMACQVPLQAQTARNTETNLPFESLDAEIEHMMTDLHIPGLSLAIIENNEVALYHTYGVKKAGESEKIAPNTVFSGASLTKSFFVLVAHQLVDEGLLDLDKPMYQYLPSERMAYDSTYKQITPRMILSHSSGMENWGWNNFPIKLEIVTTPGSGNFVYSGEGYNYLSQVVEQLLDQPYESYIQERVFEPLGLENSYLRYIETETDSGSYTIPENYAVGHGMFEGYFDYLNFETVPSSGAHFTAEDFAKLIIGIFDGKHLSAERLAEIKTPIAVMDSQLFWGPGFQLITSAEDTIIAQGGDNSGYKNWCLYSPSQKKGFVFLANSDRGELMLKRINELTVNLNIQGLMNSWDGFRDMYPSSATSLLNRYEAEGEEALMETLQTVPVSADALHTLSTLFAVAEENELSEKLLVHGLAQYPDNEAFHYRLGSKLYHRGVYEEAREKLNRARELGYQSWSMDSLAAHCQQALDEQERRSQLICQIDTAATTTWDAASYSKVAGETYIFPSSEYEEGDKVCFFDSGESLYYQVNAPVAGLYQLEVRFSSGYDNGSSHLEVKQDNQVLTLIEIPSKGWVEYKTFTERIMLPKGNSTIQIHLKEGDVNFNWLKFTHVIPQID